MPAKVTNVSLYALRVAIRWCALKHYPAMLADWTDEQMAMLQTIADEVDRRNKKQTNGTIFTHLTRNP
jgi:hypothetical protein